MEQDILSEINTAEDALRAAWSRGDAGTVADLRARLSRLWERRRAEQAARGQPRQPAPEVDRYLIATADEPNTAQAAALGVSPHCISDWRRKLVARGLITRRAGGYTHISDRERRAICGLFLDGYSLRKIAELREIPVSRVEHALDGAQVRAASRAPRYTAAAVARLLGVQVHTVSAWARLGWLPEARSSIDSPRGGRAHFGFTRADLFAFAAGRESWVAWEPGQVGDPDLAAYARLQRQAAGGRWWSRGELAALIGVSLPGACRYVLAGLFDGCPQAAYGNKDFVWLTTAEARAIEAMPAPRLPHLRAHFGPRQAIAAD
jgi:DNA-directed RNA polymerase specialized sigma24 family protein